MEPGAGPGQTAELPGWPGNKRAGPRCKQRSAGGPGLSSRAGPAALRARGSGRGALGAAGYVSPRPGQGSQRSGRGLSRLWGGLWAPWCRQGSEAGAAGLRSSKRRVPSAGQVGAPAGRCTGPAPASGLQRPSPAGRERTGPVLAFPSERPRPGGCSCPALSSQRLWRPRPGWGLKRSEPLPGWALPWRACIARASCLNTKQHI